MSIVPKETIRSIIRIRGGIVGCAIGSGICYIFHMNEWILAFSFVGGCIVIKIYEKVQRRDQ